MTSTLMVFGDVQLQDFSLRMTFELIIVFALIVIFIVSFCGLIQKIKRNYEAERERSEMTEIYVNPVMGYNRHHHPNGDFSFEELHPSGVYPSAPPPYAIPPYSEYLEPPPKYDDIIKDPPNRNQNQNNLHPAGIHRVLSSPATITTQNFNATQ